MIPAGQVTVWDCERQLLEILAALRAERPHRDIDDDANSAALRVRRDELVRFLSWPDHAGPYPWPTA